jgi:hypothetical protein
MSPRFEARQVDDGWVIWDLALDQLVGYWADQTEAEAEAKAMSDEAAHDIPPAAPRTDRK